MSASKNDYCATENRMVDSVAITTAMTEQGVSGQMLADMLGVSIRTIWNRLAWGNWYVAEAYKVCKILNLDFETVFLAHPEKLDQFPVVYAIESRGF